MEPLSKWPGYLRVAEMFMWPLNRWPRYMQAAETPIEPDLGHPETDAGGDPEHLMAPAQASHPVFPRPPPVIGSDQDKNHSKLLNTRLY